MFQMQLSKKHVVVKGIAPEKWPSAPTLAKMVIHRLYKNQKLFHVVEDIVYQVSQSALEILQTRFDANIKIDPCVNCNNPYLKHTDNYCSKCGTKISSKH